MNRKKKKFKKSKSKVLYLKPSTTGADLKRKRTGAKKKKKISKRAAARRKAKTDRKYWRPDKPMGVTQ